MPTTIRTNQIDAVCADLQMLKAMRLDAIDAPGLTPDEVHMVFESRRKALLTRLENKGILVRDDVAETRPVPMPGHGGYLHPGYLPDER